MAIEAETNELSLQKTQEQPIIIVQDLRKVYQDGAEEISAVDGVSFACRPRQFVAITGPSGCGKSTLLYLLGGLEQATSGQISIDGVDVTRLEGRGINQFRRHQIGFVFQSFHLIPNLSALENVMLPMEISDTSASLHRERARDLLIQVGIDENRHEHRPAKLSGGQQQRVAIARALANDPAVLLADEPTGNVDSKNSKRIVTLLRELAHRGRTIVVVTHDLAIAKQADLHIELEDGQIGRIMTS